MGRRGSILADGIFFMSFIVMVFSPDAILEALLEGGPTPCPTMVTAGITRTVGCQRLLGGIALVAIRHSEEAGKQGSWSITTLTYTYTKKAPSKRPTQ